MPRTAPDRSTGDTITAALMNALNADIDDLYENGSDRLRIHEAASGTPLRIDIGPGQYYVGSTQ